MYCPTKWHDQNSKHHSLETLQHAWSSVYNKSRHLNLKYKLSFTGGEVTSSKHFLPFIKWLRANYANSIHKILVTTNGSATLQYYIELFDYVDNVSFSIHSEHINEQKFFDMIVKLHSLTKNTKFLHVNVMNEFWNESRIPSYKRILTDNQISHSINEVDYSLKTRDVPIIKGKLNLAI